jgi:hypothetical protein
MHLGYETVNQGTTLQFIKEILFKISNIILTLVLFATASLSCRTVPECHFFPSTGEYKKGEFMKGIL